MEDAELVRGRGEARVGDRGHGGVVGFDIESDQQRRFGFFGCHTPPG